MISASPAFRMFHAGLQISRRLAHGAIYVFADNILLYVDCDNIS
ncbi:protein of unknown function [Methylocella tundrae]|uniref:Uncharacterized protein n=1 Tax=Methylocella tundrae TaxID=227605 RepID=A0A4V6IMN3_METTU|nr:protein of unknown function [Methylocella tundrae]